VLVRIGITSPKELNAPELRRIAVKASKKSVFEEVESSESVIDPPYEVTEDGLRIYHTHKIADSIGYVPSEKKS